MQNLLAPGSLLRGSLAHYRRSHAAVGLGVVAATSALTGALLVGDSMRASLRAAALDRLGRTEFAVASPHFFREALADDLSEAQQLGGVGNVAPLIIMRGAATHATSQARAGEVAVLGVDERFWALSTEARTSPPPAEGREVVLNDPLARELGASPGDEVLIRLGKPSAVSTETLLGRRDDTTLTLRLTVRGVAPAEGLGVFSFSPRQSVPLNAFVPLATLQRTLDRAGKVNALLFPTEMSTIGNNPGAHQSAKRFGRTWGLRGAFKQRLTLADYGLRLRLDRPRGYVALESDGFLIEPTFETTAAEAAEALGLQSARILTYLANEISIWPAHDPGATNSIPYSTIAAVDVLAVHSFGWPALNPGDALLNQWAADDLGGAAGDRIRLAYYLTGEFGQLTTEHAEFVVRGVLPLGGAAADPGFTPTYPGVTDTKRISDWDPPFPIDLSQVRDQDEAYWERYRATPKAFISLEDGLRLWAQEADRHGRLTSIRLLDRESLLNPGSQGIPSLAATSETAEGTEKGFSVQRAFEREFLKRIDASKAGLAIEPVRQRAIDASRGNTDFGMLFIGFSFFLILAALMLVALLFRLGVERRAHEIGLLLAVGFTPRSVARLLVIEGAAVAALGVALGLVGALGYGWLMLAGLRSWWSAAVSAPFLRLHVSGVSLALGGVVALLAALGSIAWAVRGLTRLSPRALLAGSTSGKRVRGLGWAARWLSIGAGVVALVLALAAGVTDRLPQAPAFFGSGAAMLISCLALAAHLLGLPSRKVIGESGGRSLARLGIRNVPRHRGRSLLTIALVGCSTFVILALEAFRLEPGADPADRRSGTGGIVLAAESPAPLPYDLNAPAGRESLNMPSAQDPALDSATFIPFRLRSGDETSCLNLYQSTKPRILGAGEAMIARGGFRFAGSLAESAAERDNPWMLLGRAFPDGAVAAIGDEAAVLWQLHSGLGRDLVIEDERGNAVRLRFVALLQGSMLQSELIVHEEAFKRLFPSIDGHAFFLIDAPSESAATVERTLERELAPFGFDVSPSRERLAGYLAVQNTYLSTFQTLGGLGLVLGVVGLAAVLLRNVWERRRELALLRAVGFSRFALGQIVLSENIVLVAAGLLVGIMSAALAVAPHLATRAGELPWASVAGLLLAVFVIGCLAGGLALAATLKAPLIPALRNE